MTVLSRLAPLALLAAAIPATAAPGPLAGLAGHWRVAGVAVDDDGVQALSQDDPSLMGKRLSFTPARLAWDQLPVTKDACVAPRFDRVGTAPDAAFEPQLKKLGMPRPTAYRIHCTSGSWGPDPSPTLFVGRGGVVAMPWYDGGLLKLTRN